MVIVKKYEVIMVFYGEKKGLMLIVIVIVYNNVQCTYLLKFNSCPVMDSSVNGAVVRHATLALAQKLTGEKQGGAVRRLILAATTPYAGNDSKACFIDFLS
ncbi:hypothetical protein [Pseudomonas syringae]|uniref:hypothetical protein n=1 Tax=Pseudomonas syringae TaxID=317 RepID=UPI001111A34E|nr:hypothetical protein [Pseudomonas syringae]